MSTQEEQEIIIIIDDYKFKNFSSDGNSVFFKVICIGREADEEDRSEVASLMKEIGKWDYLSTTATFLSLDLNMNSSQKSNPKKYKTKFGTDLYNLPEVSLTEKANKNDTRFLKVSITLSANELKKRQILRSGPYLPVDEIIKQVENIPKWVVFQKFFSNLRKETQL